MLASLQLLQPLPRVIGNTAQSNSSPLLHARWEDPVAPTHELEVLALRPEREAGHRKALLPVVDAADAHLPGHHAAHRRVVLQAPQRPGDLGLLRADFLLWVEVEEALLEALTFANVLGEDALIGGTDGTFAVVVGAAGVLQKLRVRFLRRLLVLAEDYDLFALLEDEVVDLLHRDLDGTTAVVDEPELPFDACPFRAVDAAEH